MDFPAEQLLSAAQEGDQAALQQLLLEFCPQLHAYLRPRIPAPLRSTIDVDDLLQAAFMCVFRDFARFQSGDASAFYGWIRTIADTRLKDAIRTATRKKRGGDRQRVEAGRARLSASLLDLLDLLSDQKRSPSRSAAAREAVDALTIALASLPADQHQAIRLRHIEGLPLRVVASRMGRSEPAVRGLLHRGKAALKQALGNSSAWFSKIE